MSWTLLWGPAESPLNGAAVGGSWWLAAPAAPSKTLSWDWGSLCPGYETVLSLSHIMASLTTQRPPHRMGLASPASVGTSSHCCHTAILSLLIARDAHSRELPGSCRLEALGRAVGPETVLFIRCHPWQPEQGHGTFHSTALVSVPCPAPQGVSQTATTLGLSRAASAHQPHTVPSPALGTAAPPLCPHAVKPPLPP